MSWLVGAVILFIGLVAVVAFVGSRLPVAHVATSRARYKADIDAVWAAVEAQVAGNDRKVEIVERDPPRRLKTRIPPGGPFGGTWTFDLADRTVLTITEHGEVYNVLFRFLSRFVFGHYATQEQFLRGVGTRLHETAIPERLPAPA